MSLLYTCFVLSTLRVQTMSQFNSVFYLCFCYCMYNNCQTDHSILIFQFRPHYYNQPGVSAIRHYSHNHCRLNKCLPFPSDQKQTSKMNAKLCVGLLALVVVIGKLSFYFTLCVELNVFEDKMWNIVFVPIFIWIQILFLRILFKQTRGLFIVSFLYHVQFWCSITQHLSLFLVS